LRASRLRKCLAKLRTAPRRCAHHTGSSLSSFLCEKLIPLLVVGGWLEAEAAGEVDVEGVEGFLPAWGAGAEITASFV
jgi:hypothetical protein